MKFEKMPEEIENKLITGELKKEESLDGEDVRISEDSLVLTENGVKVKAPDDEKYEKAIYNKADKEKLELENLEEKLLDIKYNNPEWQENVDNYIETINELIDQLSQEENPAKQQFLKDQIYDAQIIGNEITYQKDTVQSIEHRIKSIKEKIKNIESVITGDYSQN